MPPSGSCAAARSPFGTLKLTGGRSLDISRPAVMSIVNCTLDSFWEASRASGEAALEAALRAEAEGAQLVDFGAESTRPGSQPVEEEEELSRLIPVIEAFRARSNLPVSVDTRKLAVAEAAIAAGADIVNDVSALGDSPGIAALCARTGAGLVLMHMQGRPETMQDCPQYRSVVEDVRLFLEGALAKALKASVPPASIIVDPGFGFGKKLEDNLDLLSQLAESVPAGYPVLVGLSRKSMIGSICGREVADRLAGSLAAQAFALERGASILRVHDTAPCVDLIKMWTALQERSE